MLRNGCNENNAIDGAVAEPFTHLVQAEIHATAAEPIAIERASISWG